MVKNLKVRLDKGNPIVHTLGKAFDWVSVSAWRWTQLSPPPSLPERWRSLSKQPDSMARSRAAKTPGFNHWPVLDLWQEAGPQGSDLFELGVTGARWHSYSHQALACEPHPQAWFGVPVTPVHIQKHFILIFMLIHFLFTFINNNCI